MPKAHEHSLSNPHLGCPDCELLQQRYPGEAIMESVSTVFKQFSDPSRLRIFWFLCHCEECVLGIASFMNMSSPSVSHHLRLLKSSGLIVSRRVGKEVRYRMADTPMARAMHIAIDEIGECLQ